MTQQQGQRFASDYIDVATRLVEFRTQYPEGSLQPADPSKPFEVVDVGGKQRIVVVAAAYRTPDDPRPGIGMAYEEVPGRTPYTRDSELQNAETSAWGRAIVAALAADTKKGIASAEEVRNRQADREVRDAPARSPKKAERGPLPPEQDQWSQEGPKERKTDGPWMEGWRIAVLTAEVPEALDALETQLRKAWDEHRLTVADKDDLKALITEKRSDLASIAADWPAVAPIPGDAA